MGTERWLCSSCGAASDPAAVPPPGCARCDAPLHLGKFGLIELLAPEQSCRVFRGRESNGSREVTIRLLPENQESALPDLRQAVKRMESFSHPNIAATLEAKVHQGRAFIVEEFVPGESVTRADLTLREGMSVMRDVALAFGAAHDHGVVHPELRADCLKVSRGDKALGGWRVSVTGFVGPGNGTVRANLHAIGSILYSVATGRPPGSTSPSSLNPLIDTALESIIRMAMDTEASHQPPGAEEIAIELTRWLKGNAPTRRATIIVKPQPKPPQKFDWRRIRAEVRIAAGISLALLMLILFLTLRKSVPPKPVVPAPDPKPVVASAAPADPPKPAPVESPKPPPPPEPKPLPVGPPKPPEPKPAPVGPPKPPPPPDSSPGANDPKAKGEPKPVPVEPPKPPEPKPAPVESPKPPPPPDSSPGANDPKAKGEPKPVPVEPPKPPEPKPAPVEPPKPPPPPEPKPIPPDPPKPPPKGPVASSVGTLASVHAEYGMFVALKAGTSPAVGEEWEVVRSGKVVGRLAVESLSAPEKRYPDGCAVCKLLSGSASPGDAVRRVSK